MTDRRRIELEDQRKAIEAHQRVIQLLEEHLTLARTEHELTIIAFVESALNEEWIQAER